MNAEQLISLQLEKARIELEIAKLQSKNTLRVVRKKKSKAKTHIAYDAWLQQVGVKIEKKESAKYTRKDGIQIPVTLMKGKDTQGMNAVYAMNSEGRGWRVRDFKPFSVTA